MGARVVVAVVVVVVQFAVELTVLTRFHEEGKPAIGGFSLNVAG
jgi:hypothetical protein